MRNHKTLSTASHYPKPRRRWLAFALSAAVLFISLMIGCTDQAQIASPELIDPEAIDTAPGASALFLEPDVSINNPRHFLVHRIVLPPPVQDPVALMGQFDAAPRPALVRRMRHLINPARKIHNGNTFPIVDEDEHLTAYRLSAQNEPVREVLLENQFGRQVWIIGNPRLLYAPAQKEGHAFPDSLDHYKCYEVLNNGGPVNAVVGVSDQFISFATTTVREGKLFCVPVRKQHGNRFYDINNPVGHLAVYSIDPITMDPIKRGVRDQFDERTVTVLGARRLIAESRKLGWLEID